MWRQLIWLGLSLLGVAAGKLIFTPPEGDPVRLYKLSLDQDGAMFVVTDAGIYKRAKDSNHWSLFFNKQVGRDIRTVFHKNDRTTLIKAPLEVYQVSTTGKVIYVLKPQKLPVAFGNDAVYYCGHMSKSLKTEKIELNFPSYEKRGGCTGGITHQDHAYIRTENYLLEVKNEGVKIIDKFKFDQYFSLVRHPDIIRFDLADNLYTTAERAYEGGKEKLPRRFVVKIRPDGTLSKILNFGFKDFTPKSIHLVGVVDNDVFINVNGKDLYVSRDGGKTASRISKIKNERNNINCAGFYEIIKGPDNLLYALDRDVLYKSRDRGETWEIMDRKGIPSHYKD